MFVHSDSWILGSLRIYDCFSVWKNYFKDSTFVKRLMKNSRLLSCEKYILNGTQTDDLSCFRRALDFMEYVLNGNDYNQLKWVKVLTDNNTSSFSK